MTLIYFYASGMKKRCFGSLLILICFEPIYLDNDLTRSHFSKIYLL